MIVIPMAGLSSRFAAAGYDKPKFMLPLSGKTVFDHAVGSFQAYFDTESFLFVARGDGATQEFVTHACAALGIAEARVVLLRDPTAGQAETVEMGLAAAGVTDDTRLTIFNIDTFRPGFTFPDFSEDGRSDGYLEVFVGSGSNWSYVRPAPENPRRVAETAEKRPISNLCCTGLYHFAATGAFLQALAYEREHPSTAELYVAPLYNHLIATGAVFHFNVVEPADIVFCGVPSEYEALLEASAADSPDRQA